MPETPLLEVQDARRILRRLPGAVRRFARVSRPARSVAVIGANGAGKSTLLKSIAGLDAPAARRDSSSRATPIGGTPGLRCRQRAASRWCPKGAGCFHR